jgi:hypothetical protein
LPLTKFLAVLKKKNPSVVVTEIDNITTILRNYVYNGDSEGKYPDSLKFENPDSKIRILY